MALKVVSKELIHSEEESAPQTQIIRYGDRMPDENTDISIFFDNERLKRLRHGS